VAAGAEGGWFEQSPSSRVRTGEGPLLVTAGAWPCEAEGDGEDIVRNPKTK